MALSIGVVVAFVGAGHGIGPLGQQISGFMPNVRRMQWIGNGGCQTLG